MRAGAPSLRPLAGLMRLIPRSDKRRIGGLVALGLVSSVTELFGLSAILLLLQSFANPEASSTLIRFARAAPLPFGTGRDAELTLTLWITLAFFVRLAVAMVYSHQRLAVVLDVQQALTRRLFTSYLTRPYGLRGQVSTGELLNHLTQTVTRLTRGMINGALNAMIEAMLILALLALLMAQQPVTTLLTAGGLVLVYGLVNRVVGRLVAENGRRETEIYGEYNRLTLASLRGLREIRMLGMERDVITRHDDALARRALLQHSNRMLTETPRYLIETGILLVVLAVIAGHLLAGTPLPEIAASLTLFGLVIVRMTPSANRLMAGWNDVQSNSAAVTEVESQLAAFETGDAAPDAAAPLPLRQGVSLREVTVRFPGAERPALDRVSIEIPRGRSVGIIGGTGGGKTTLLELIAGLSSPDSGDVLVDGAPLDPARAASWRRSIGYVPQSVFLFDDTVAANIRAGRPESADAMQRAIAGAALDRFAAEDPARLDASVGEIGDRLSGGQRQRIGIARALYGAPELLILDEGTSALDLITENQILAELERLKGSVTLVVVAHRLSAVAGCDVVYWLENGRIRASGPYAEVVKTYSEHGLVGA